MEQTQNCKVEKIVDIIHICHWMLLFIGKEYSIKNSQEKSMLSVILGNIVVTDQNHTYELNLGWNTHKHHFPGKINT